jgi:hypothetical protein
MEDSETVTVLCSRYRQKSCKMDEKYLAIIVIYFGGGISNVILILKVGKLSYADISWSCKRLLASDALAGCCVFICCRV